MTFLAFVLLAATASTQPQALAGYHVDVFARDLENAGVVLALDDGTVLVSRPQLNDVIALRDRDGDGRADEIRTAVASIENANGLAMRGRTLYVAGVKKIVAAERLPDGTFTSAHEVVNDLPDGGPHPNRTIGVGPDGKLYVSIGGTCNECTESNPESATMLQMDPDGSNRRIFARGLRNTAGFDWHPETHELWGTDDGELNRIGDGLHYDSEEAAIAFPSATPIGFAFDAEGDAFSALKNKVVRIRFKNAKPVAQENFISGLTSIAGVDVARDGALLFTDDANGIIYRVAQSPRPMMSSAALPEVRSVLAKTFHVSGLATPESVIHDEVQDVYFVSNINGAPSEKDGNGFISRITPDGKIETLKFITGIDAPKGMAIRGDELWVADIDRMHAFDRVTGKHLETIDLSKEGAVFLNDVIVGPDELLYVTDSDIRMKGARERVRAGDGRVFRIQEDDEIEVALSGEELHSPNGIAWDGTHFLIAQMYGNEILSWSPGSRAEATVRGRGDYDGIVVLPSGAVIVSSHHDAALHIAQNGELRPLFTRPPSPAGIGFDRKRNRLLVPSLEGNWLEGWTLPPMEPPQKKAARAAMEISALRPNN